MTHELDKRQAAGGELAGGNGRRDEAEGGGGGGMRESLRTMSFAEGEARLQAKAESPAGQSGAQAGYANEEEYNRAHPGNVAEFNELTSYQCADVTRTWVVFAKVRAWQRANGLEADARIGPKTLARARATKPPPPLVEPLGPELWESPPFLVTTHATIDADAREYAQRQTALRAQRIAGVRVLDDQIERVSVELEQAKAAGQHERVRELTVRDFELVEKRGLLVELRDQSQWMVVVTDAPHLRWATQGVADATLGDAILADYRLARDGRGGVDEN